jgi:hypothetical protein
LQWHCPCGLNPHGQYLHNSLFIYLFFVLCGDWNTSGEKKKKKKKHCRCCWGAHLRVYYFCFWSGRPVLSSSASFGDTPAKVPERRRSGDGSVSLFCSFSTFFFLCHRRVLLVAGLFCLSLASFCIFWLVFSNFFFFFFPSNCFLAKLFG